VDDCSLGRQAGVDTRREIPRRRTQRKRDGGRLPVRRRSETDSHSVRTVAAGSARTSTPAYRDLDRVNRGFWCRLSGPEYQTRFTTRSAPITGRIEPREHRSTGLVDSDARHPVPRRVQRGVVNRRPQHFRRRNGTTAQSGHRSEEASTADGAGRVGRAGQNGHPRTTRRVPSRSKSIE
jgi:hypothetical protein